MATTTRSLRTLTTGDLMSRKVITIPEQMSLLAAARLLYKNQIGAAPVVNAEGRCIGILSSTDFVHWVEEGAVGKDDTSDSVCPFQIKGRMLTGEDAVICVLEEGSCPWQELRPSIAGGHTAICHRQSGTLPDWHGVAGNWTTSAVRRFMTTDIVSAKPDTPLPELARMMIDAHIHHLLVLDEMGKPVGIVTSTDLLAALADDDRLG